MVMVLRIWENRFPRRKEDDTGREDKSMPYFFLIKKKQTYLSACYALHGTTICDLKLNNMAGTLKSLKEGNH